MLETFDILKEIEDDEELIEEHKEKFVVKASTLVSEWQKVEATKLKMGDEPKQKEEEQKKEAKEEDPEAKAARVKAEQEKKAAVGSKSGQLQKNFQNRDEGGDTSKIVERYITTII